LKGFLHHLPPGFQPNKGIEQEEAVYAVAKPPTFVRLHKYKVLFSSYMRIAVATTANPTPFWSK
jgi:hypothetical protein